MATKPYTIRLDEETRAALEREAALEERPAAQLAARAIKRFLAAKKAELDAIDAALEEADRGEFVPAEEVHAWMKSWGTDNELPRPRARKLVE